MELVGLRRAGTGERTMRRVRDWWAAIPEAERVWLVEAERLADRCGGGGGYNMPDGYGDCPMCSSPSPGGLCNLCLEQHAYIIAKADAAMKEIHANRTA